MKLLRWPTCLEWFAVVVLSSTLAWSQTIPDPNSPEISQSVTAFLEALFRGQAHILAGLGTDPFTFDGRVVRDRTKIMQFWEKILKRHAAELKNQQDLKVSIFDYANAVKQFGPPPKSLSHLKLKQCYFAAITFTERNGFLLIITKIHKDSWRVAAITD